MEESVGCKTETEGRADSNPCPGHTAQQEWEQLRASQLSSKPDIDLCPPLIAIKKGKSL